MRNCLKCDGPAEDGRYYCSELCAYWGMIKRSEGVTAADQKYALFAAAEREKNHERAKRLKEIKQSDPSGLRTAEREGPNTGTVDKRATKGLSKTPRSRRGLGRTGNTVRTEKGTGGGKRGRARAVRVPDGDSPSSGE